MQKQVEKENVPFPRRQSRMRKFQARTLKRSAHGPCRMAESELDPRYRSNVSKCSKHSEGLLCGSADKRK